MKAHLIDPFARTVTEVEYSGDLADAYRLTQCDCIDSVRVSRSGDRILIDDEGLILNLETQRFFVFFVFTDEDGFERFLAGRSLLVGADEAGMSIQPAAHLGETVARINFFQETEAAQAACMEYARILTGKGFQVIEFRSN